MMNTQEKHPTKSKKDDNSEVLLSEQRTLLSWIRTALALMTFGFVVARFGLFLKEIAGIKEATPVQHFELSLILGTILILLAVFIVVVAAIHNYRVSQCLKRGEAHPSTSPPLIWILSGILSFLGIGIASYLIWLDFK